MHIHIMRVEMGTPFWHCTDRDNCRLTLRYATFEEATWIHRNDGFRDDGPMYVTEGGAIAVPLDWSRETAEEDAK